METPIASLLAALYLQCAPGQCVMVRVKEKMERERERERF